MSQMEGPASLPLPWLEDGHPVRRRIVQRKDKDTVYSNSQYGLERVVRAC